MQPLQALAFGSHGSRPRRWRWWQWLGLLIAIAGTVAAAVALVRAWEIGTCASGGPFVSRQECPPETGGSIGLLVGGIFGAVIGGLMTLSMAVTFLLIFGGLAAGFAVAAYREEEARGVAIFLAVLFPIIGIVPALAIGATSRLTRTVDRGSPGTPGDETVLNLGHILRQAADQAGSPHVSARRIVIDARQPASPAMKPEIGGSVAEVLRAAAGRLRDEPSPAQAPPADEPATNTRDIVAVLERLERLRASGAITEEEFAALKRRALS
jgi:hypothetical protein